jgi:fructose-1,6-bisphosphatase II
MLYCGERIGDGSLPRVDIAVDPLDGTTACATGRSGAVAVIALSEHGALFDPGPCFYMARTRIMRGCTGCACVFAVAS